MKKFTLSLILAVSLSATNDMAWVDEQIDAIKPARSGEKHSNISRLNNPFIFLEKNGYVIKKKSNKISDISSSATNSTGSTIKPVFSNSTFKLSMIMNNSALINKKWYKVGDKVNQYKIIKISKASVTLKEKSKIKVISTITKNNNLKFKR